MINVTQVGLAREEERRENDEHVVASLLSQNPHQSSLFFLNHSVPTRDNTENIYTYRIYVGESGCSSLGTEW